MKKIIIVIMAISLATMLSAQLYVLNETFATNPTTSGWTIANGSAPNKWVWGTLQSHENVIGSVETPMGMYITSDASATTPPWHYDGNVSSTSFFYRNITIPANVENIEINIRWGAGGEVYGHAQYYDHMRVYLRPAGFVPTPGEFFLVEPYEWDDYQIGRLGYAASEMWTVDTYWMGKSTEQISATLIFAWINDDSIANQPPIAIDYVTITYEEPAHPDAPYGVVLRSPLNEMHGASRTPRLVWERAPGPSPTHYQVMVARDQSFSTPVVNETISFPTQNYPGTDFQYFDITTPLGIDGVYYWRVIPSNTFGSPTTNETHSFTTVGSRIAQIGEFVWRSTYMPTRPWMRYSYTQSIYYPSEIKRHSGDKINALGWRVSWDPQWEDCVRKISVYMAQTDLAVFSTVSSWVLPTNPTWKKVYEGPFYVDNANTWSTVYFQEAFVYDATKNLVIAVWDDTGQWVSPDGFRFFVNHTLTNRTLYHNSDEETYNVHSPVSSLDVGTDRQFVPTILLYYDTDISETDIVVTRAGSHLMGNYPNPFNPSTTIRFHVESPTSEPEKVTIDVFNIKGQKVRSLISDFFATGSHTVTFDGLDDSGKAVTSGIYLYRMQTADYTGVSKMVLMK
jgi:hypothetical protein